MVLGQSLLPQMPEVALLELSNVAEHLEIRPRLVMVLALDGRELDGAEEVDDLGENIILRARVPVCHRVLGEDEFDSRVKRLSDGVLSVVVVDVDALVGLEEVQIIGDEDDEVASDAHDKPIEGCHLGAAVGKRLVLNGQLACEHEERRKQSLPRCQVEAVILVLAVD